MNGIDFSIIIPHSNSLRFLPKLFSSIPKSDAIEILLVDNSPVKITPEELGEAGIDHDFTLLFSNPSRSAGGARNVGIEHANGKWLLFMDADDYFAGNAFDAFYRHFDTDADVVYFSANGIYEDTGERSDRCDPYARLVNGFLDGSIDGMSLRLNFVVPWAKMVRKELVERHSLRYEEVVASADVYFSILTGYYATRIEADNTEVYVATVSKGSLSRRRSQEILLSRYEVVLRCNKFLKQHRLGKHQKSIMSLLYYARAYGVKVVIEMLISALKYRQNIFIGFKRWYKSYKRIKKRNRIESKYIVEEGIERKRD